MRLVAFWALLAGLGVLGIGVQRLRGGKRAEANLSEGSERSLGSQTPTRVEVGSERPIEQPRRSLSSDEACRTALHAIEARKAALISTIQKAGPPAAAFKWGAPDQARTARIQDFVDGLVSSSSSDSLNATAECRGLACRVVVLEQPNASSVVSGLTKSLAGISDTLVPGTTQTTVDPLANRVLKETVIFFRVKP